MLSLHLALHYNPSKVLIVVTNVLKLVSYMEDREEEEKEEEKAEEERQKKTKQKK